MTDRVEHRSVSNSSLHPGAEVRGSGDTDSIRIAGTVNGKAVQFILDSGANRSLVRSDVLSSVSLPEVSGGLRDVTGRRTPLYGPAEVDIQIGGVSMQQPVYVAAELSDEAILGFDFLQENRCILDFERGHIRINERNVCFRAAGSGLAGDRSPPSAFRLRVMAPVTVEPGVEMLIRCKAVGRTFDSLGIIEAGPLCRSRLMVGRTVIDPKARSVQVLVANVTDKPIRVRAGTSVGSCEPVDLLSEALAKPSDTPREDGGESFPRPRCEKGTGIKTLPANLSGLLEESAQLLSPAQRERVADLLTRYADVFSVGEHDLGRTTLIKHEINTGNSRPVKVPPRRIPISKRQEVEDMVEQLSSQGLIEKSSSPWSSALVLVRKKDGSLRCCVDYRLLNAATIKDSYPLPRIDDTLDALSGSTWFSTLDLKSGYHQVAVAEADKPKTAFSAGNGLWQWRVMPFGLCNAPATFERLMESVLSGLHWRTLLVYLDDVIVFGRTFEEELERLEDVFLRMRIANLKLNPKKCLLFRSEVPFLGHVVSRNGVKTDPSKTVAVAEWPVPANVKELRSFLGFCTYYRRFVRDFAKVAAPLHALTKEGVSFEWSSACQDSFDKLRAALQQTPVLTYPDNNMPFILDTDASSEGIGAVLSQTLDGVERVVAYFSRTLKGPEKNYCVTRKELLAVVDAVRHFHTYLYGSRFTIRSDHSALQWLKNLRDPEGQLARWLARLGQYDYQITYRPGKQHANADGLSRRPCKSDCGHCCRREKTTEGICRATKVIPANSIDSDIRSAQRADPDLAPLLCLLETKTEKPDWSQIASTSRVTKLYWAQWEQLRMRDGILQKRWESTSGLRADWLNVIPKSLRGATLTEAHGSVAAGHLGTKKTLQRLRERGYWVNMRRDVQEWCRVCDVCAAKKGPPQAPQAPLQIVRVGAPMERVAVDVAGPFPVSSSGNRYIVVVIDYFTKWPEAFAVPNQEAATVARVLVDEFFSRFGLPNELHSDQGRNFESKLFQECCQLLNITKTRTTPLHPESDGMVERFNRTLVQEMAKRCRHGQDDWDQHIPTILMSYRSAVHEVTGYSPAELMLGRGMRLPLDLLFERPPDDQGDCSVTEWVQSKRTQMQTVRRQVESNLKASAAAMKQRKDVKASQELFEEGDGVWLFNPRRKKGQSPKLTSPWEGPYRIVKRLSAVTYRVQRSKHSGCRVVHFNRLWKTKGPPQFSWTSGSTRGGAGSPEAGVGAQEGIIPPVPCAAVQSHPESELSPGLLGGVPGGISVSPVTPATSGNRDPDPLGRCRPQRFPRRPRYLQDYDCN